MKSKLQPKKKIGRPQRILAYVAGVYERSFDSVKEASRWERNSSGHWHDLDGRHIPDPDIKYVTTYCDEEDDNEIYYDPD